MGVDCIFHIKTAIPKVILNQILSGAVISDLHYGDHGDEEHECNFIISNDLHQLNDDGWLEYEVKSAWTGTIYKVRCRKIILNYSLYDCRDDVDNCNSDTVIEIQEVPHD